MQTIPHAPKKITPLEAAMRGQALEKAIGRLDRLLPEMEEAHRLYGFAMDDLGRKSYQRAIEAAARLRAKFEYDRELLMSELEHQAVFDQLRNDRESK